ncbi:MAG: hypothetical protein R3A51_04585 [Nannocystaceae bacterium]
MRLTTLTIRTLAAIAALTCAGSSARAAPDPEVPAADPEDILGEIVVTADTSARPLLLPKIGVELRSSGPEADEVDAVLRRDLDLSGEFVVLARDAAPPPETADAPLDRAAWRAAGAATVVRLRTAAVDGDAVELSAEVYLCDDTGPPIFTSARPIPRPRLRAATHALVDAILRSLTGYSGPFVSALTFVRAEGGARIVYTIDPDGHGLRAISTAEQLALAPALGPGDVLHYAASVNHGRQRLYRAGVAEPLAVEPRGSIHGLAFSPDRARVALSIATDDGVQLFTGDAELKELTPQTRLMLALHPAFSPSGHLAYAGTRGKLQRVYVDKRPVSPPGISASSPTFCRHPDGTKLVYSVGVRQNADLIVADERGRDPVRLTRGRGRNSAPACSPDGRLIAFFSTRKRGDGPGLYLMRVDGRRPRKIADVLGDSLQWARVQPD